MAARWLWLGARARAGGWLGGDAAARERLGRAARGLRVRLFGPGPPQCASLGELYAREGDLFENAQPKPALGSPSGRRVHDVLVIDNFYEDPDAVRAFALGLEYEPYLNYPDRFGGYYRPPAWYQPRPFWFSSALEVRDNPLKGRGVRLAHEGIRGRLSEIVQSPVDEATWDTSGDGWNGAFHYKVRGSYPFATSMIHNHVGRDSDVVQGWSGVVYLTPGRPRGGTSIWRSRQTGACYARDSVYSSNYEDYEPVFLVENVYNRLLLLGASVLHFGEEGFGTRKENARLFQTFFFNVRASGPDSGAG
jgi:hypothetical protein